MKTGIEELVEEIAARRTKIIEDFAKTYLGVMSEKVPIKDLIEKVEMVEKWHTADRKEVSWFFRLKDPALQFQGQEECRPGVAYRHFLDYQQNNTNFGALLWRLIIKADKDNLARLRAVFPAHCALFEAWLTSNSEEEFHQHWKKQL